METKFPLQLMGINVSGDVAGLTIYTNRRGLKVAFLQSPPAKPLSVWQLAWQRNFRVGMKLWAQLTAEEKLAYRRVCDCARLCMLGHNLWLHAFLAGNNSVLETLQCQYGIPLKMPPLL